MKKVLMCLTAFVFYLVTLGVYFFCAAIWDEMENEIYIYNYDLPYGLIDFVIWRVAPLLISLVFLRVIIATCHQREWEEAPLTARPLALADEESANKKAGVWN